MHLWRYSSPRRRLPRLHRRILWLRPLLTLHRPRLRPEPCQRHRMLQPVTHKVLLYCRKSGTGAYVLPEQAQVLRINDSHDRSVNMDRDILPIRTLCSLRVCSISVSHSSSRAWDYDQVPAKQLAVAVAAETASASLPDSAPAATSRDAASCTAVCSSSAWDPTSCIAVPAQEEDTGQRSAAHNVYNTYRFKPLL